MVWGVQFRHTADAVLMVLASERYQADDYVQEYDEYLQVLGDRCRSRAVP